MPATFITGDALATLAAMPDASFDAMLCDPPYGISFMGREWDHGVPSAAVWREALRVLKPGAFALVACGTRTQHRMATALEDAGFEIRDLIAWVYGSGFPKSHDASKAIDKAAGAERKVIAEGRPVKRMIPGADQDATGSWIKDNGREYQPGTSIPATPDAERWQGYGTALKPAMELWTLVRKPPEGTVAANAIKHGTGALNIDGARIPTGDRIGGGANATSGFVDGYERGDGWTPGHENGRWPANLIHDGSDEATAGFPAQAGASGAASGPTAGRLGTRGVFGGAKGGDGYASPFHADTGSAARFFYAAKASRAEREAGLLDTYGANPHPTVKPLALTTYLATLLLPPARADGAPRRILTPFSGVASEVIGALRAGWDEATGIELDADYVGIARARVAHWVGADLTPDEPDEAPAVAPAQASLFDG